MKTDWKPRPGFLLVEPTRLPTHTEAGLELPEEFTTKNETGIVFRIAEGVDCHFLGKEVFFPRHNEYQVIDSDTGEKFYVVNLDHIILWRNPPTPKEFFQV